MVRTQKEPGSSSNKEYRAEEVTHMSEEQCLSAANRTLPPANLILFLVLKEGK